MAKECPIRHRKADICAKNMSTIVDVEENQEGVGNAYIFIEIR